MTMLAPFVERHAEAAAALHARCFPDSWPSHAFTALLQTGAEGFACLDSDRMLGLILSRAAGDEAEILTFAVDPDSRNQGLGKMLLVSLLARLETGAITRLFLEVAEDNEAALAVYGQTGFIRVGERSGYYIDGGAAKTALIMARDIISPA
jgi:ribosomal-protein-alanine N-acetyltransferase